MIGLQYYSYPMGTREIKELLPTGKWYAPIVKPGRGWEDCDYDPYCEVSVEYINSLIDLRAQLSRDVLTGVE